MKVILLKNVAGVGQEGSLKDVADGYGLNFLIARKLAVQATPAKIIAYAAAQKQEGERREKERTALNQMVRSLDGVRVELSVRATPKGGLFKSITISDIVKTIADQRRVQIPEAVVQLAKPIKETGDHKITIASEEAKAEITLAITASA